MTYNLTTLGNSTSILAFTQGVNTELMAGYLGVMLLIGIGLVLFMSFQWSTRDTKMSIAATSFIVFALALLMRAMDLIENFPLFLIVMGMAIAIAFTWRTN